MLLGHSREGFCRFTGSQDLVTFWACHRAAFAHFVQVIGCSNSMLIEQSYDAYSVRRVAVNSASDDSSLGVRATEGSLAWAGGTKGGVVFPGFDANFAAFGASAVWYPLCIKGSEYKNNTKVYNAFKNFVTLLRARTTAPLYVSWKIGEQATCTNAKDQQQYVFDHAIADGLALAGPDIPPASVPDPTNPCHFDPLLSTNVADAAIAFLDGG